MAFPELEPLGGPSVASHHTTQEISYKAPLPLSPNISDAQLSYSTAVASRGQMKKGTSVAGITQAHISAVCELLSTNKYFLEYKAGSKNTNKNWNWRSVNTFSLLVV